MKIALATALALALGCASSTPPAASNTAAAAPTTTATATASSGTAAPAEAFQRVTVDSLAQAIEHHETVAVFDNNSQERYAQGHIPGARWVSHDQVTQQILPADRNARLVFYCYNESCHACHNAADAALALGYTNVAILPAGITGWAAAGKPVVTGTNPS